MAMIHLNTTGSNTSPYDTWAKAATSWATAQAGMAAGDTLVVDKAFTTAVAGINLTFPGTPANPNLIIGGTPAATSGLSDSATGAAMTTSNTTFVCNGSYRMKSITLLSTSGSSHDMTICGASGNVQVYDTCAFNHGSGGSSTIYIGATGSSQGSYALIRNSSFKLGSTGQTININNKIDIDGFAFTTGGSTPTTGIFTLASAAHTSELNCQSLDLTLAGVGVILVVAPAFGGCHTVFRDVRLPASWSGTLAGTLKAGNRIEMWNGDNANTNYRCKILDYAVTINESTSIYVTATTVAGTSLSYKCDTTANCSLASVGKMALAPILVNQSSGTYTVTVEIARDGSATPYLNSDVWLEIEYLGTTSSTLGVVTDNACDLVTFVTSGGSNATSSSATWTGLSGTNNKMKLQVTITPKKPGYILPRVCMAKASSTFYVDAAVTVV